MLRGALRCPACGVAFQGFARTEPLEVDLEVEQGRVDEDTGELVTPGLAFRVKGAPQ